MRHVDAAAVEPRSPSRWWFVGAAIVSVGTMPLTAVWLMVLAPLVFMGAAVVALVQPDPQTKHRTTRLGLLVGGGLLLGPAVYVALALVGNLT